MGEKTFSSSPMLPITRPLFRFFSLRVYSPPGFCTSASNTDGTKEGSIGRKEFSSGNWTQERQQAVTESLLQTQKHLQNKWRETEEMSGGDEGSAEDVIINANTGEVGGPKGPEPTRYGDWERKGRVSDF